MESLRYDESYRDICEVLRFKKATGSYFLSKIDVLDTSQSIAHRLYILFQIGGFEI